MAGHGAAAYRSGMRPAAVPRLDTSRRTGHRSAHRRPEPSPGRRPARVVRLRAAPRAAKIYADGVLGGLAGTAAFAVWTIVAVGCGARLLPGWEVAGAGSFAAVLDRTSLDAAFLVAGGIVTSRLLAVAQRRPQLGFGVVLVLLALGGGYLVTTDVVADRVLDPWPSALAGNAIAAVTVAIAVVRRRGGVVRIRP
jgi:hypothetical protein